MRAFFELAGGWPEKLRCAAGRLAGIKKTLRQEGWILVGDEPLKLTLDAVRESRIKGLDVSSDPHGSDLLYRNFTWIRLTELS